MLADDDTQQEADGIFFLKLWCLLGRLRPNETTLRAAEVVVLVRRFRPIKCREAQLWGARLWQGTVKHPKTNKRGVKNTSDRGASQPSFEPSCGQSCTYNLPPLSPFGFFVTAAQRVPSARCSSAPEWRGDCSVRRVFRSIHVHLDLSK